jgi:hypothetical protein
MHVYIKCAPHASLQDPEPPSSAHLSPPLVHAPRSSAPKVDTNCTAPSLIPTVNVNTVRSFSAHGHQSAAKGSSTTVSRSDAD